jgi:hypothetical protein
MEVSTLSGEHGLRGRPLAWARLDLVLTLVWAIGIVAVAIVWNEWALGLSDAQEQVPPASFALVLVGVPVVFGGLAGLLIHREGGWIDALIYSALGAACLGLGVFAAWTGDPRACTPEPGTDCDLGYGFGAFIVTVVVFVPFLAGSTLGRGTVLLLRRLRRRR